MNLLSKMLMPLIGLSLGLNAQNKDSIFWETKKYTIEKCFSQEKIDYHLILSNKEKKDTIYSFAFNLFGSKIPEPPILTINQSPSDTSTTIYFLKGPCIKKDFSTNSYYDKYEPYKIKINKNGKVTNKGKTNQFEIKVNPSQYINPYTNYCLE